ncbi:MAG: uroporphyrinogen-III synthase [Actinomycetota bacterium]|nr:uroporphyrinogen-III synthase [Actinomycetota bacterium]
MEDRLNLTGRVVGVTADRRGDDQAVLFGRLGAEVLVGPTIATDELPDPELLRRRTEELIAEPPDFSIANTGIGMRTWLGAAADWGVADALVEALARSRIAARGPKAAGALSSAGLSAWWRSPDERLDDVIRHLTEQGLSGKRVAFQLHGDDGAEWVRRLEGAGAQVTTLPVYMWRLPADDGPARELIRRTVAGQVDAVTFTAGPQVHAMLELADRVGQRAALLGALNEERIVVGCIGPVCAAAAGAAGVRHTVVPDHWRLGSLVKAVAAAIGSDRRPHRPAGQAARPPG